MHHSRVPLTLRGTRDKIPSLTVFVDAGSREIFSYQPQIVPENRVAVPAL